VLPWTQILGYIPSKGHMRHRQAMAAWLARGGLVVDPDHLVLTAGAQHGLAVTMSALLKPNDTLLMEELTYSGARALAHQQHLKIRAVAIDAEGLRPDALETACRSTRARALYCMPRLQNPTSAIMSERRRRQIAAIAEKYRLTVIEDDVYGFVSPEKAPLAALIINARRGKAGEKGLWGPAMAEAINQMLAARMKSIAFLKSGWIPAIKYLEKLVKKKAGAPRMESRVAQIGKAKGSAKVEGSGFHAKAIIENAASAKRDKKDALDKFGMPALQRAFDFETLSTWKKAIEREFREAAQAIGIKTKD